MTPAHGEVWLFDLGMEGKIRPALIVSVGYGDIDRALLTIVPPHDQLTGFSVRGRHQRGLPEARSILGAEHRHISERESHSETWHNASTVRSDNTDLKRALRLEGPFLLALHPG
jgi:hypothetical protein